MKSSTRLLIDVAGFGFNLSGAILFAVLRQPLMALIFVAIMFISYQGIHRVMDFLDACDTAVGGPNEEE